jgi:CBS domain-containing protein
MKVKDLMTPVGEYSTFGADTTLSHIVVSLSKSAHRDVLIIDDDGNLMGILTTTDILSALEPNYKKLKTKNLGGETLTHKYVADVFKEFGLWADTLGELCKKGCDISVSNAMYVPEDEEYLDENDDLEHGVHNYIMGVHQPIIVRKNGKVTGVLRLNDVFEEIKKRIIACALEQ